MVKDGISSFIDQQWNLRKQYELHDTRLVIDGHRLQSMLYRHSSRLNRDYVFGCDYRSFAETVEKFFRRLKICNIIPVVVFDGSICSERYKSCFYTRIVEIKCMANDYLRCYRRQSATLTNYVFLKVANDFEVTIKQTNTETVKEIAELANKYKCPLVSDKSEFLVLNIEYGVIQFEGFGWFGRTLKYNSLDNYWYLSCKHYQIDNLLVNYLGLRKEMLPLFATIIENDYFTGNTFLDVIKETSDSFDTRHHYSKHEEMNIVLNWMRGKDMDKAMDLLENHFKNNRDVLNEMKAEMKKYEIENNDCESKSMAKGDNERVLPNWFLNEYRCGVLRPAMMNIVAMKTHVLYPQIEDFSQPSSYCCTLNLRRFLYAILRTENDRLTPIKVMDRKGLDGVETYEVPLQRTLDGQYVPTLQEVRQLDIKQRYELLMNVLGISESYLEKVRQSLLQFECDKSDVVESTTFMIVVLKYLITTEPHIDWSVFSNAVIACILFYSNQFLQTNPELQSLCYPPKDEIHSYNPKIVHCFAQFQACLHVINFINAVLEYPLKEGRPHYCLNGIFIYNISTELSKVDDPNYLNDIFENETIFSLHQRLLQLVLNVPSLCYENF